MSDSPSDPVQVTVVVPMFNEQDNIVKLHGDIVTQMEALERSFEVIFVNDGSTDRTAELLDEVAAKDSRVRAIHFIRNFGQTAAMMAGFDHAAGEYIVPMDGDGQNDPKDIGRLLTKLEEGFDVVSGWRKDRKDNPIKRNLPSRIANSLISRISGVHLHDYGCSMKAYRRSVLEEVRLYGEMHRFVPIYASWQGGRVCELPVTHHPRMHGTSKYGLSRIFKVLLDLMLIKFLADYQTRPIHVFGAMGFLCFLVALLSGLGAIYMKVALDASFIQTPLPLLVVMSFLTGVLCILLGLLAELLIRVYYEAQGKSAYAIKGPTPRIRR